MTELKVLTDGEIWGVLNKEWELNETGANNLTYPNDFLRDSKAVCQAQVRKLWKWGNAPCPHLLEISGQLKHDCGICWDTLREEE